MKMRKRFESRWFAMAVICLALAVLFSGCPTDGSSSNNSNNSNNNDVVSGIPYNYTLSEIWELILARNPLVYSVLWSSTCRRYTAEFEREQNPAIYQLRFGVTNRSVPNFAMGLNGQFNIGGWADFPFYGEKNSLSMERNDEGGVSWVIHNSGGLRMSGRGTIIFDYYESEIRRVMFHVTEFRRPAFCDLNRVQGLNNNTWLYPRQH